MNLQNKLIIVTDSWHPLINGVVTTLHQCVEEGRKDGWLISVIDPGQYLNFPCPGYSDVRLCLPLGLSAKLKLEMKLTSALGMNFHIHIATEGPLGLAARRWCLKNNVPFTTAYHTKWPEFLYSLYKIPMKWTNAVMRWFHGPSSCVLTTTTTMMKELQDANIGSISSSWTRGVDSTVFCNPRLQKSTRDKPMLLSVGRVSKEKNLDAFCSLDHDKYELVVVGDGPYRSELQSKYPNVQFKGSMQGEALAGIYGEADVMVFSSKLDTFGLVMIEAQYMGTPVAAYPVTGPLDVIQKGITGCMDDDLAGAVEQALALDRTTVSSKARALWTWKEAWKILRDHATTARTEYYPPK